MRAREFYLIERRLQYTSPTSIKGYIDNIMAMLKHAEDNPDIELLMDILFKVKPANIIQFQPAKQQSANLQKAWDKVYKEWQARPPATNTAEQTENDNVLKQIWTHRIEGTVDGEQVSWQGEIGYPLSIFEKTKEIKGSERKSYNTGNMTEGIFASAIYLRLRNAKPITVNQLISFMVNQLAGSGQKQPKSDAAARTKWTSTEIENPVQDKLQLIVTLAPNNFEPLKNRDTMMGLSSHINAIVNYVNTVEIQRIQEEFLANNIVDSIIVRAAGTEDEKGSKVDIDIVYQNANMTNPEKLEARYSRSMKTGNVDQFGQKSAGGAAYDSYAYDEYEEEDFNDDGTAKDNNPKAKLGRRKPNQSIETKDIIQRRWNRQHVFWKTFGIDIATGKTQKDFKDNWEDDWLYEGYDFIKSFKLSYEKATKQFNKSLSNKNDRKEVETLFKALQWHARRNDPNALVTNFDDKKGTYEELDFNMLDGYIAKADLRARYSLDLNTGEETKRPGIQILANSPGNFERKNADGTVEKVEWKKGDIFMKFRLFVGADKITNLIEKGPLIRKWTEVASG
tara:strand:- start:534 stop:2228 length:1695 start_codon:yes stop_codon:yes gene_type:complete